MAEQDDAPEGWEVRHRPALIAAVAMPAVMLALLLVAGHFYDADLRPKTWRPIVTQPAPGLETYIHDGGKDPHRPHRVARPDPSIAAAKRAVAAEGLPGWRSAR